MVALKQKQAPISHAPRICRGKPPLPRGLTWCGSAILLVCAALAFVAACLWVENHHPGDDPRRALMPRAQRWVTRPVVDAVGRTFSGWVRSRMEARYLATGLSLRETIRLFRDDSRAFVERRSHAYRLAREATPEALAALHAVLPLASPDHRAHMAGLIGKTCNPAALECLWPLLDDPDRQVAAAAAEALGMIGGHDATSRLASLLADPGTPAPLRHAAALALGSINHPDARRCLAEALRSDPDPDLAACLLRSLGRAPFADVGPVFREYLESPATPAELRAAAVESLSHSDAEAVPFLLGEAALDGDPEVRAAAAWALSTHDRADGIGPDLADMATREQDPDVRRRLYEAMLPRTGLPAQTLLPLLQSEDDIAARVAGFNVAGALARHDHDAADLFDREFVPELETIATRPNSTNLRMRAVFALRQANTPATCDALARISSVDHPAIATAARNGLSHPRP